MLGIFGYVLWLIKNDSNLKDKKMLYERMMTEFKRPIMCMITSIISLVYSVNANLSETNREFNNPPRETPKIDILCLKGS